MNAHRHRQRGEGKIGCILSMLVLVVGAAVGIKAVPVYWSNNELKDAAEEMASRASVVPIENIELQLRSKAKELEIPEALKKGAITASKQGDGQQGTCVIRLSYKRTIDLYGVYTWIVITDTKAVAPYMNSF